MVFGFIKSIDDFLQTIAGVKPRGNDLAIIAAIEDPDYSVFSRNGQTVIEHHPERGIYRAWFNDQSTKMKNNIGRMKGYGACSRCSGTWNWKKNHATSYSASGGMFPLCEECYQECTPQERYDYCRKLWVKWGRPEDVDWGMIAKGVGLHSPVRSMISRVLRRR